MANTVTEPMMFSPYNPDNIEITETDVISILTDYGLPGVVNNIQLYKRAFIHRSYTKKPVAENTKNKKEILKLILLKIKTTYIRIQRP